MKRREAKRWRPSRVSRLLPDGTVQTVDGGMHKVPRGWHRVVAWFDVQYGGTLGPSDEAPLGRRAEAARRKSRAGRKRR